ncbi:MAG TPA: MaoC family dehydratase [Acidobacteriaceae bacterium]|jgi:acyl dehydratase|nr:MaoC family dehydratase [Acidobacteriaceae bacterium]
MTRYFEDFSVGQIFRGGPVAVDATGIKEFAAIFDPQPFHLDETAATQTFFKGLAASGWQTAGLTMRMMVEALGVAGRFIGIEVDQMRWPLAVRPGDLLRVEVEIAEMRPLRSRPDYGLVKLKITTLNQADQPVQHMRTTTLIGRRS